MSYLSRLHCELNHSEGERDPQRNNKVLNNYDILNPSAILKPLMLKFFYILFNSLYPPGDLSSGKQKVKASTFCSMHVNIRKNIVRCT